MKRILLLGIVALGLQLSSCAECTDCNRPSTVDTSAFAQDTVKFFSNGVVKQKETENFVLYRYRTQEVNWAVDKKLHQKIDSLLVLMNEVNIKLDKKSSNSITSYSNY